MRAGANMAGARGASGRSADMLLSDWMRVNGVSDPVMADAIGGVSIETVRKLRFRAKGVSLKVAARIDEVTRGEVRSPDLLPLKKRAPSISTKVRP